MREFAETVVWNPRRRFTPAAAVVLALEAWQTDLAQAVLAKFYRVHSRTVRLVAAVLA